jgi:hypothetical protein
MKDKFLGVLVTVMMTSGCELLPQDKTNEVSEIELLNKPICVWQAIDNEVMKDCHVEYWIRYWASLEGLSWSKRKEKIDILSDHDADILKKVMLSQGKDTPYQNRFRAQFWLEALMPKLSQEMKQFIKVAVYQPSLEMLEMESALVTLSKTNSRYEQTLEKQTLQLSKQAGQIEQLLNIETSIIQIDRNTDQELDQKDNP